MSIANKRVLLGVSGGISAYKSADLASKLVQLDLIVDVVMTEAAIHFVGPATFEAITGRRVHVDTLESWTDSFKGHVTLGNDADVFVVAPATANTIAKLALGLADDMLSASSLASSCPLLIAPAMEHTMFHHSAVQSNLGTLIERGAVIVGPNQGRLASGDWGDGRMAEPVEIAGAVRATLGHAGTLAGSKIVVTAGGTQEPLDPIRFIGNRSSGLMGYAVAQAAVDEGAHVTLITGPSCLTPPVGCEVVHVGTAREMQSAVELAVEDADAIVMSAAVSDFRPATSSREKIKKQDVGVEPQIPLVLNPDIVGGLADRPLVRIGFAAETENLVENATKKLTAKNLDMVVANDAEATIGQPTNRATLVHKHGEIEPLETMPKSELAKLLVTRLAVLLESRE